MSNEWVFFIWTARCAWMWPMDITCKIYTLLHSLLREHLLQLFYLCIFSGPTAVILNLIITSAVWKIFLNKKPNPNFHSSNYFIIISFLINKISCKRCNLFVTFEEKLWIFHERKNSTFLHLIDERKRMMKNENWLFALVDLLSLRWCRSNLASGESFAISLKATLGS